MNTPFDLIQALRSWFFAKDGDINTGGRDINTGGGDVITGAGSVDGVDLTTHVGDADAHHNQQHAIDGADHTGQLDHGADLLGLADDDHAQYHNNTRGDARYFQVSEFNDNPGSSSQPLKSDSDGFLELEGLGVGTAPTAGNVNASGDIVAGDDVRAIDDIQAGGGLVAGNTNQAPPSGVLMLKEVSAPPTPASGYVYIYAATSGRIYSKDDTGTISGPL